MKEVVGGVSSGLVGLHLKGTQEQVFTIHELANVGRGSPSRYQKYQKSPQDIKASENKKIKDIVNTLRD